MVIETDRRQIEDQDDGDEAIREKPHDARGEKKARIP
jgi:hypothetical protein